MPANCLVRDSVSTRSHAVRLFRARVVAADLSSATVAMATTAALVATLVSTEMAAMAATVLTVPLEAME